MIIIPYDDYNSRVPPKSEWGYIGTITTTAGHSALRNGWKIIEVEDGDNTVEDIENQINRVRIRKLTPEETFILQGMTVDDCQKCRDIGISNTALYKATGNGLISNCVSLIMEHFYKALYDESYKCYDENFPQPVTS